MISQDEVIEKLKQCLDPELGINVVDLGLIYSINIEGSKINILMTLTNPGCPLESYFIKDINSKIKSIKGVSDVSVELTFDPQWTSSRISEELKDLPNFSN